VTPAFELWSATTAGARGVLVKARRTSEASDAAITRLVRAHAQVEHPRVPKARLVCDTGGRRAAWLDCDVALEGMELKKRLVASGQRIPWAAGDWFIDALRSALRAAHAASLDGRALVLGHLGFGNVLFSRTGAFHVVGFGANVALENEHGALATADPVFFAPEVAAGGLATPSSDIVASLMLKRALAPLVELPEALARALRGEIDDATLRVVELATWFDREVIAQVPARRPPLETVLQRINAFRSLLGAGLDREGFEAMVREAIDRAGDAPGLRTLEIESGDHLLCLDGGPRVRIGPALLRILARVARDPSGASTHELLEAGWPGESAVPGSGEARVYTAIRRLRRLGLEDVIERVGGQYRIASSVRVALRA
jgi:hypothetical protein